MSPTRRPRTALVVDDSAGARRRIGTLLRLGGWRVHEAVGMAVALDQAAAVHPDLVVTDMTMRLGNGPLLLRALRQRGCDARFLAVSSEVTEEIRARAAAADAVACLAKPVEPHELVDVLLHLPAGPMAGEQATGTRALHIAAERLDLLEQMHAASRRTQVPALAVDGDRGRPAMGPGSGQATSR
jgi:CheY-like chemotaxis protein